MDPLFELDLRPAGAGPRTLAATLNARLKAAILDGRLRPGARLPATRALALRLGVSRNTVIAAYDLLLAEGYVVARPGAGSFVGAALPVAARRAPAPAAPAPAAPDARLAAFARAAAGAPRPRPQAPACDFALGVPDKSAVHFDDWRRLSARALRQLARRGVGYGAAQGEPVLREAIAGHVSAARAVACAAGDVVVTAGAQQAFDLLARILVTPGRTAVAVEDPGYPPARAAFAAAGARLVPVRVDAQGLVVEAIPPHVRVVCVTPAHQFPLGCAMSAPRRRALLEFARRQRAVIVEDDYDGEFRFGGRPLDALQTLAPDGEVFFVGTFSKNLFPALRLGYVVAPPWALAALVAAKERADWHCNLLAQHTLAAFIAEGHLARHVRRMRALYAARRARLLARLEADFAPWLAPVPAVAGLHLAATGRRTHGFDTIVARAAAAGAGVHALRRYGLGAAAPHGLVFGYGAIDEAAIDRGLDILRTVMP